MTRLGFNTRVSFDDDSGPEQGLLDGLALFRAAERLGYQSGWVYQRHFDHYLSSPLPFLAAVGQHTRNIRLGEAQPGQRRRPTLRTVACLGADLQAGQHGFGAGGQQRAQHGEHEFHRIHRDWEAVVVVSGLFTGASVEDLP